MAGSAKQDVQVTVGKDLSTATIQGVKVEVSPDSNVVVYTNGGVQTKPAFATGGPHGRALSANEDQQISIGKDFNTVALYGAKVELAADGSVIVYTNGTVKVKPVIEKFTDLAAVRPANDPQIGDAMPAGHPNAGWIFMGPDEETGKDFYAAPKDESGTFTFNEAAKRAQSIGAQVPTKTQLDKMYKNRDQGALKDTFNLTGSNPAGWYWSSSQLNFYAWTQRLSDGNQHIYGKHHDSSLRCVR